MKFDKWFDKQSLLIKFILLVLPIGWFVEVLVRISAFLRKNSSVNLVGLILGIIGNWVYSVIDLVVLLLTGRLLFIE